MQFKQIVTVFLLPVLTPTLFVRFMSKSSSIMGADQKRTAELRHNPFHNSILQFAYFMLWYPEYRSVFHHRSGKLLKYVTPPYAWSEDVVY